MSNFKSVGMIRKSGEGHWVGDGFPVQTMFSYSDTRVNVSPFLLLDYAGPKEFPPTTKRLGVGQHPHRGFETVTIVYHGEVEHRDSSGGGGKIGAGDVQWMTAAAGIVHEEFHGAQFAKSGGLFEMVQLWVNLPKKDKMSTPTYQSIMNAEIPKISLPDQSGLVRVIAGSFEKAKGPARTFSPLNVFDIRMNKGGRFSFENPSDHTNVILVLKGQIELKKWRKSPSNRTCRF
jgi:redox-sensitive bicupin YhaK (pirin superfamily)